MSNTVLTGGHAYDPLFYANEAIVQLEAALGMAATVHRGYEKSPQSKGSIIEIRVPDTFAAQDAPSAAQDLNPTYTQLQLNYWREVKFKLSDKELTLADSRIIEDHIRPAAYALAEDIDTKLNSLYKDIPWFVDLSATPAVGDITGVRKILQDNRVPLTDVANMFLEIDPAAEKGFLDLAAFSQDAGSGATGVNTQITGMLGRRFGFNVFTNQNVKSHVAGTTADLSLTVNNGGGYAVGDTAINLDAAGTGTVVAGDVISFAGHSQKYSITGTFTASGNAFTGVTIFPALKAAVADDEVATLYIDSHVANMGYHRHAFALGMAPLSEMGNELGAKIGTVADPRTNLALRSRLFYDGNNSAVYVALDVLFGVKTLDSNKAARLRG